jgi:hypothetical protein
LNHITYNDYVIQLDEQLKNIVKASQEYQLNINEKKISKSLAEPTRYSIGDYVLVAYPGETSDKLMFLWKGPFITYYCRDFVNNQDPAADISIPPSHRLLAKSTVRKSRFIFNGTLFFSFI